ncbi:MAG TPA: hypothetical protein VMN57_06210 [Anaerolineales bacterium]|nr:hypothetical protein [Anaerolineales bacterium]
MTAKPVHSLHVLLSGLIDYAGMFPPANLGLRPALRNHLIDLSGDDAWMLAGFILSVDQTEDTARLLKNAPENLPIRVTVLGKGGPDWTSFFSGLDAELDAIATLRRSLGERFEVAAMETRLPGAELDYQIRADALVDRAAGRIAEAGLRPYFEVPADPLWQPRAARALDAIGKTSGRTAVRFKLRTGGVKPEAFPTVDAVAWILTHAREAGAALKCTAGLHHPIRGFRQEVRTKMHGFINVFTAAVLSNSRGLPAADLARILSEEDPDRFSFDDGGLSWNDFTASTSEIETARRDFAVSFGSCSFDEPREDLRRMGWV